MKGSGAYCPSSAVDLVGATQAIGELRVSWVN